MSVVLGTFAFFLVVFVLPMVLACVLGSMAGRRDAKRLSPNNRVVGSLTPRRANDTARETER